MARVCSRVTSYSSSPAGAGVSHEAFHRGRTADERREVDKGRRNRNGRYTDDGDVVETVGTAAPPPRSPSTSISLPPPTSMQQGTLGTEGVIIHGAVLCGEPGLGRVSVTTSSSLPRLAQGLLPGSAEQTHCVTTPVLPTDFSLSLFSKRRTSRLKAKYRKVQKGIQTTR